jgi:IclR family KDG regulon transcriptional repressor
MKTVKKSLAILDLFLTVKNELSIDELATLSGINKSTTRRIIMTFIDYDFVKQPPKKGKYSLGMKFLDFSQTIKKNIPFVDIAEPFLTQLGQKADETAAMAIWNERDAIICLSTQPNHPLKVSIHDGTMRMLHQSSLGKAILAGLPDERLNSLIGSELRRFTPNTITDIDELKRHLAIVRRDGVATDDEEGYSGVRGIACAFKNEEGGVAGAVTLIGPTIRITREKAKEYVPLVKDCAQSISKALGYKGCSL